MIGSYLRGRQQLVCISHYGKSYFPNDQEIKQGACFHFGTLDVNLYMNELAGGRPSGVVCQYADDTNVILEAPTVGSLGCLLDERGWNVALV